MENILGEHWHQDRIRHSYQADDRHQDQDGADRRMAPNVAEPFQQAMKHGGRLGVARGRPDFDSGQRYQHCEEAQAIEQEAPCFPGITPGRQQTG